MKKKLIEVALPLETINREAAREKSIRHGHPSTLHLWWARRPLAACRAVLFAQLVDDPSARPEEFPTGEAQAKERQRLFELIERMVVWENSNDEELFAEAHAEIVKSFGGEPPPILDPFCGGGSIPLEAQRLGLQAHASDLNPVAVLITKALVELPAEFAGQAPIHPDLDDGKLPTRTWKGAQGLAEDVRYYGKRMRDEAERRIGHLYPNAKLDDGREATVIAWIWARTVACPNPACGVTIPLVRSFWLSKRRGSEAWLRPLIVKRGAHFEVEFGAAGPEQEGTMGRAGATCLACGALAPLGYVKTEGTAGRLGDQLLAIVAEDGRRRVFLPAVREHIEAANVARPDEPWNIPLSTHSQYMAPPRYGLTDHLDLFTNRQLTALLCLVDVLGDVASQIRAACADDDYTRAVTVYLALAIGRLADLQNSLARWENTRTQVRNLFGRQAFPMLWDYAECGLFSDAAGDFGTSLTSVVNTLEALPLGIPGVVNQRDARATPTDVTVVVSTDPPYYDNVPYADLADFFYPWLRAALSREIPDLFATMSTPKVDELVADRERHGGKEPAETYFEAGFRSVFRSLSQCQSLDAPLTVFYAFKQAESTGEQDEIASTGWVTMLDGLLASGLAVTATWPMRTELRNRLRGEKSNALASSIAMACRQRPDTAGITDRAGFVGALRAELPAALRDLQQGAIAPVDLAQASIGPGMAIFSRFARVVEPSGEAMRVRAALALINQVLDEVLAEQEGEFDASTRWAVKWFEQYGFDTGPFGQAEVLFTATGTSLNVLEAAGVVASKAGKVKLLAFDELPDEWDPATDLVTPVWEVTLYLVKRLEASGIEAAGELLAQVGGLGDQARDLAYRMYNVCEKKKWSVPAQFFNALGQNWADIARHASAGVGGQGELL